MFKCSTCKKEKFNLEFSKDKSRKNGLNHRCRSCDKAKKEIDRKLDIEHRKVYSKQHYRDNVDHYKTYKKEYRNLNLAKEKLRDHKSYIRHKDKVLERQKRNIAKKKDDPIYKLKNITRRFIQRSFDFVGILKENTTSNLLGYTLLNLQNHLNQYINKNCLSCNKIVITKENSHCDHYHPICNAKTVEDVIRLNQLNNLRLICKPCNIIKRNYEPIEEIN